MSLFKREPRTVYRVYGEDEYFGHEQPVEGGGLEVTPAVDDIDTASGEGTEPDGEWPPLPYRGSAPGRRPLAVGLLVAAVIGVLALVAAVTFGGSSSRVPRAAAVATAAPGAAEARGGGAATSGDKSGAAWASRARTRVRARVNKATRSTTAASRVGRSQFGSSRARAHTLPVGVGPASVSFAGARPAATAPVAAIAEPGGEAHAATPAAQVTDEFGFER
jgi:hypothetical protein